MSGTTMIVEIGGENHEVSFEYHICSNCRGHGQHVNPAVDGHGISMNEFYEDPDFYDGYMAGHYDIRCEECNGSGKIRIPIVPKELEAEYEAECEAERWDQQMAEAERRMGC